MRSQDKGEIISINGPIIKIQGFSNQAIGDMVEIGQKDRLIGEIINLNGSISIVQCYEETAGISLHDTAYNLSIPLSMELGPGILNAIYDGIQRPLEKFIEKCGDFMERGIKLPSLDREKMWEFNPIKKVGDIVGEGDIIGVVKEGFIDHKIMVPLGKSGTIEEIKSGNLKIDHTAYTLKMGENLENFTLIQKWPIRKARPYKQRLNPNVPLITGTRIIDLLFPIAIGGTVAVPGGFGTGKTIVQQSLAKFAHADIIVYIGCGERGNEMAELLEQFPELQDPRYNKPLMQRTIMVANTSNMPVAAREASIFSGITIAEYWRDQGKNVLLLADSTSRWAEALRELSGRLEEMPTEGGYPAYLSSRLSNFYERAGFVETLGSPQRNGSVTIVGAVSPPSGDFSEPVTKTTKRFIRAFWALDARLAYARHYPSINWIDSYSLYENLGEYWDKNIEEGWEQSRALVNELLSKAGELQNITMLMGAENLPQDQQLVLFFADMIKNSFLIQNAFDSVDRYCSPQKTIKMIKIFLKLYNESLFLVKKGVPLFRIKEMECLNLIQRARLDIKNENLGELDKIISEIIKDISDIQSKYMEMFE